MSVIEIKVHINVVCLNHPESVPPPSWSTEEELSSVKPAAGAERLGTAGVRCVCIFRNSTANNSG